MQKTSLAAIVPLCLVTLLPLLHANAGEGFPVFSKPRAITSGPKDHLYASYYAVDAWSVDGRYATILETEVKNRLPTVEDVAVLGVVDEKQKNRFIPLTETRCWNFQEATMAHWLPPAGRYDGDYQSFIFNDLVDGQFVSVIYDMRTRTRRVVSMPISAVSPDGRWAVSINYARLRLTRPDYGYDGNGQDARADTVWPEDDGLWLIDLKSGKAQLIVTIASARAHMPEVKDPKGMAYFCHTKFSRDGSKIFWLARSVENLSGQGVVRRWQTTSFTCNRDGSQVQRCFPDGWGGSHFNWLDGERLLVTAKYMDVFYTHVFFSAGRDDYQRFGQGALDFDGHAVFSDDGLWVATDGYPDKLFQQRLMIVRMTDQAVLPLGNFFVPEIYRGTYWRCDLHSRWSADGKKLGINSTFEGSRQAYVIDVSYQK